MGQNSLGTRAGNIDRGGGAKTLFPKKIGGRRLFFEKIRGAETFFRKKTRGRRLFFRKNKGGEEFFRLKKGGQGLRYVAKRYSKKGQKKRKEKWGHKKKLQWHEGTRVRKKYQGTYSFFVGTRFLSVSTRARDFYLRATWHVGHGGIRFSRLGALMCFFVVFSFAVFSITCISTGR